MDNYFQDWIPIEIISEIFKYLSRMDRMSCSLVCLKWKNALCRQYLWKKIVLHVDKDFLEPSTILFVRKYHRHIKSLEVGWNKPLIQYRWLPLNMNDLTKRMVQFILILYDNWVQLQYFKFSDWYDVYSFNKIVYHLSRYLKIQTNLKKLTFRNMNLPKMECMRILSACIGSKMSVTHLEIHNNYYNLNTAFVTNEFVLFLEEFSCLIELRLDYFILSQPKVIDVVIENGKNRLKFLEIYFDEPDLHSSIIPRNKWRAFKNSCPEVTVSIIICLTLSGD